MTVIIHTSSELDKLREAGRIVGLVHKELKALIMPGVTTKELERVAIEIIAKEEGVPAFKGYKGYPHSICTSVNNEIVHGFPSNRELKCGDVLSVDVGVLKENYYGDAAFTVIVDRPLKLNDLSLVLTTRMCLNRVISHIKEGVTVGSIGNLIESTAQEHGFEVVKNYIGHGIGRELHMTPAVYNYGKDSKGIVLKSSMVICCEPMLVSQGADNHTLEDGWTVVSSNGNNAAHVEAQIIVHKDYAEVIAG